MIKEDYVEAIKHWAMLHGLREDVFPGTSIDFLCQLLEDKDRELKALHDRVYILECRAKST